jgi:hypothetical protein
MHQLQVAYSQTEDRLLLRFNTHDGVEFCFLLTRLFVKKFWPGLVNTLDVKIPGVPAESAPAAGVAVAKAKSAPARDAAVKEKMLGFVHQAVVEKANFTEKYEAKEGSCPLGDDPILVCRAQIQPKGPDSHILRLYPEKGNGVELGVDQKLLHLLSKLILDTVAQIDWGLSIKLPGSDMGNSFSTGEEIKGRRSLH